MHPAVGTNLVTSLVLDGSGNVTGRTTADGVTTSYAYDALSRLASVAATGLATIGYGYDELSRRTSMTDGTGVTSYAYDRSSRLTQVSQPSGTIGYGYDLDANRTAVSYPGTGGGTVSYAFSKGGRLSSLSDWAARSSTYTYTAAGLAKTAAVPGGLTTTYSYDRANRLTGLTNMVGSTGITTHAYTLDAEGNRTAQSEFVSGITAPGQTDPFAYAYDGLNRLVAVTTTNAESFTLDGASNITARTGPSATYTIDGENRPTSDGTSTLVWSSADRLTARGADTFSYDPLDRLVSSTVAGTTRTYAYSGDGLLQSRTQGAATSLLWDPAVSIARLLQQGGDRIVYGLGPLYIVKADGTTRALARDGGKSVRAEVDGTGAVTGSWRYRAYGQIAQSAGQSAPTTLGYAGQLLDPSGLYNMRARWYESALGRFVTSDLVSGDPAIPGSLARYAYAQDNPLTNADPTGLFCITIGFGSKVAAGATSAEDGKGAGGAAMESLALAICNGGRGWVDGLNIGLVTTTGHFVGSTSTGGENVVDGAYAGFGLQLGLSPQAIRAEDLAGPFVSDSVDGGLLWPADFGIEWARDRDGQVDVITVTLPFGSAGVGLDYTRTQTVSSAKTLWQVKPR